MGAAVATPLALPSRRRELFGLCLSLARSRLPVVIGLVLMVTTTVLFSMVGGVLAARGRWMSGTLPGIASEVLAWGPGMLVTFAAALHAFRSDAEHGVFALVLGRGISLRSFVVQRVFALAALLGASGGLGVLVVGTTIAASASSQDLAAASLLGGVSGMAHAIGFGLVMAPVAFSTLGARSRSGGYVALVLVLAMPEVLRLVVRDLPPEWSELMSIPSCLATLRTALSPGHLDGVRALSAISVLALVALIATAAAAHQARSAWHKRLEPT